LKRTETKEKTRSVDKNVERLELSYSVGDHTMVQLLWKTVWQFLNKLSIELPYGPAELRTGVQTKLTRSRSEQLYSQ